MTPHFIYCTADFQPCILNDLNKYWPIITIRNNILTAMENFGIRSSILTVLHQTRNELITKERTKQAYKGELKNFRYSDDVPSVWSSYEASMNEDLESLLENLQSGDTINEEMVHSYFLPKLTNEELKAMKETRIRGLYAHLETNDTIPIWSHFIKDIDPEKMKKSNSSDRYLHCTCWRWTVNLNDKILFEGSIEDKRRKFQASFDSQHGLLISFDESSEDPLKPFFGEEKSRHENVFHKNFLE